MIRRFNEHQSAGTVIAPGTVPSSADTASTDAPGAAPEVSVKRDVHTIWGLTPAELHERFWAARGVQVVRRGEQTALMPQAELYLLLDEPLLVIFRLGRLVETLSWLRPRILFIRLHSTQEHGYREQVLTDEQNRFLGFRRHYGDVDARVTRVAVTRNRALAAQWQRAHVAADGWRRLRREASRADRAAMSAEGHIFDRHEVSDLKDFVRELVQVWKRPDVTIDRARPITDCVWHDARATPRSRTRFVGPVWIGAGRSLDGVASVVGPAVLWDDPEARPDVEALRWDRIEPTDALHGAGEPLRLNRMQRAGKRGFDICFALLALAVSLPAYPLIMLAIWLEDGGPFFFGHRRETLGGREFPCLKFRSMRKDAEQIKDELVAQNRADGPQFYIEDDPRLTRVGKFLRDSNLDELPQFFNVLAGHMAVVGPRPSPHSENQYCPPWREARLSVRPGITGLWQVMRSRAQGLDFQEWIRYDIEYVERLSWRMDLWILWRTFLQILRIKR